MREITFRMTFRDWQEGVEVGISHLTLFYCFFWSGVLLLVPVGLILILWGKGYLATWPPTHLPPRSVLLSMGTLLGMLLTAFVLPVVLLSLLSRSTTVQISPSRLVCKRRGLSGTIRWQQVTTILDTGQHLCFCREFPFAVVVPKSAFPNHQQADAFLEEAVDYWRRETGQSDTSPENVLGVWPPAPLPHHSEELDGKRRR